VFWLSLFEALAGWRGWHGLMWSNRKVYPALLLVATAAFVKDGGGWGRRIVNLALTLLPAFALQLVGGSLRQWAMNPLTQLRPGRYMDRTITRFNIPLSEGYLPALHITPTGGARASICVLHGSGCDKTFYAWRLVDLLIARGVATLLIDLDGHGENPRPQSFPAIIDNARVAVGWLRARYERVGLLGISLGGCVAARAVADGVTVDGLAVLEAPPRLHYTQSDIWREALALAQPALFYLFNNCTPYHMYAAWKATPIRATVSTWDLIESLDLIGSLQRVNAPLLLLYGGADAIVKPSQAEEVRNGAPLGASYTLVPGASHLTLIMTPRALRAIDDWVSSVLSRG
jgi:alpha-beta hydrolase superfamily lysophospholipase